jgi:hypothetical protein
MRWRAILIISLAANLALVVGWLWSGRAGSRQRAGQGLLSEATASTIKTNFLVRRQFFTWQELESDDYPTYIKNLRDIGCPEQTIRDIIIADVNTLYARRRALEVVTPEQQWWRTEPDPALVRAATERVRELDRERTELLARLLGTNWESGDLVNLPRPTRQGIVLDGPVLGNMPNETKQAVESISLRSTDRMNAYIEEQRKAGKTPDPAEMAKLRQQTRADLAAVLSPLQLEEFLLRYSQNAITLRAQLKDLRFFDATAEEFRALFRATDPLDVQLNALAGPTDATSAATRRAIEQQRTAAIKNALGAERYELFKSLQDPTYREAYLAAQRAGTPEAVGTIYEINLAAQQEQARIRGQTNLTAEQLGIELKKAELEQLKAAAQALGQQVPTEAPPPLPPEPRKIHTLKNGETVNFLAQLYGVEPSDLRAANPNIDFSKIKGGEQVNVPLRFVPVPVTP